MAGNTDKWLERIHTELSELRTENTKAHADLWTHKDKQDERLTSLEIFRGRLGGMGKTALIIVGVVGTVCGVVLAVIKLWG